jgi:hypothetical protein
VTAVGVPAEHRFVVGAELKVWLFAEPHTPLVGTMLPDELPEEELEPDELDGVLLMTRSRVIASYVS